MAVRLPARRAMVVGSGTAESESRVRFIGAPGGAPAENSVNPITLVKSNVGLADTNTSEDVDVTIE